VSANAHANAHPSRASALIGKHLRDARARARVAQSDGLARAVRS
jgi:hypothetical protein